MAAVLVELAELKAAVHGLGGSALYADADYQRIADAAEEVLVEYLDGVAADFVAVNPVRVAALQLAVELFQARHSAASSGVSVDLNPYKLGRTLVSRYQGLLMPWWDTATMVG